MVLTERAYLAGLIDGEGCIILSAEITPNKRRGGNRYIYRFTLQITNTSLTMINWLLMNVGGVCFATQTKGHRVKYDWRVYNEDARIVLRSVLPFLTTKREQANLALEYTPSQKGKPVSNEENTIRLQRIQALKALKRVS